MIRDCHKDATIDVIGVVVEIGQADAFTTRNQTSTTKRPVTLVDMSQKSVSVFLLLLLFADRQSLIVFFSAD